ncbi:MAG: DUF2996 domain-containing protein [Oscillatoria sp. PMC 1051.18]|nr:DUF2996 domain-containing protein [Oscillatoria sp. PMC 1050.18]MEC5031012.1 DUF2996 domain-containing protein [Oscillatoria sp. PMC 1051.18]
MAEENNQNQEKEQNNQQQADEKAAKAQAAKEKKAAAAKAKAKAKKEKPPAPEDKPFPQFIEEEYKPALKEALAQQGIEDIELTFTKDKLPIVGAGNDECWQVIGNWQNGKRQFNVYFLEEDIKGQKAFSWAVNGRKPSTIESFMIDERRINLDLLVFYTLQRLNGQKWLVRN